MGFPITTPSSFYRLGASGAGQFLGKRSIRPKTKRTALSILLKNIRTR
jgi:hypothetical protein